MISPIEQASKDMKSFKFAQAKKQQMNLNRNLQCLCLHSDFSVAIAFLLVVQDFQILGNMLNTGGVSVHVLFGNLQ